MLQFVKLQRVRHNLASEQNNETGNRASGDSKAPKEDIKQRKCIILHPLELQHEAEKGLVLLDSRYHNKTFESNVEVTYCVIKLQKS